MTFGVAQLIALRQVHHAAAGAAVCDRTIGTRACEIPIGACGLRVDERE